ncbi:MAG TPA: DUF1330 domain-containing protein [Burkholderiales bacterium]|nr:DUF1330 domain-containing protein [Burkholderiales bacterium]
MAAYLVAELEVTDPTVFEEYRKRVAATIAAHGGRYLVRGGALEALEGGWNPKRMVILEFPSLAQAKTWYASPEYQELLKLRQRSSKSKVVMIEGV